MTDQDLQRSVARLEGRHDALDTYLSALLERVGQMEDRLRDDMRAMEGNLRSDMRASRWERVAIIVTLIVGFASVTATLFVAG